MMSRSRNRNKRIKSKTDKGSPHRSSSSESNEGRCLPSFREERAYQSQRLRTKELTKRYRRLIGNAYASRPEEEELRELLIPLKSPTEPQIDLGVHRSYVLPSLRLHRPSLAVCQLRAQPTTRPNASYHSDDDNDEVSESSPRAEQRGCHRND